MTGSVQINLCWFIGQLIRVLAAKMVDLNFVQAKFDSILKLVLLWPTSPIFMHLWKHYFKLS